MLFCAFAACGKPAETPKPPLYTTVTENHPDQITFLLPGALTTTGIFGPAREWAQDGNLVVEYRLPGMQGEPLSPPLNLMRAATWVADYANRYPDARINLLGYSTGAAIALEAAGLIDNSERVKVAAISSATPFPGAAFATLRGGLHVAGSAISAGSFDPQRVWEEYFITLYLGSGWRRSPAKRELAEELLQSFDGRINTPGGGRARSQSASLLFWTVSPAALDSQAKITFFHGESDPVFPLPQVQRLAARLDAPVCVLPEDGHMVLLSRRDLVERVERVFFAGGEAGTCG